MPVAGSPQKRTSWISRTPVGTRVWTAGRILILAIALSATFGAFFLTAFRVTTRAREVKVPDLRNKTLADATAALTDIGLVVRVEGRRPDPKVPADRVLEQEPAAGAVLRRQRAVRLRVSDGQRAPVVPALIGQPERTAEIMLTEASIQVGERAEIRSGAYAPDAVVAQDPPERARAAAVTLLVNRGQTGMAYVMPDVIGTYGGQVRDMLRRRGFRVSVTETSYPGLAPGIVVHQTPQAGFQITTGDPILLEFNR
jgi:serine/threonine-protein kinase